MREKTARDRFRSGELDSIRLGGYGGTVNLEVIPSGVRVRLSSPRRQEIVGPDTEAVRVAALAIADGILGVKHEPEGRVRKPRERVFKPDGRLLITAGDVWRGYLQQCMGLVQADVLDWPRKRLASHWESMTPAARLTMPSLDYVNSVLLAARFFARAGVLPFDGDIDRVQAGDLTALMRSKVASGYTPHTLRTYFGRLRTAVRSYRAQWEEDWGGRRDPTENAKPPSTVRMEGPPEIGEDRARTLIDQLRRDREWRAWAAAVIALESGRRIGAIGARRLGTQLDAPPLCESDFSRSERGRLEVTWRANAAKGHGFGRGDEIRPCTRRMEEAYRFLRRFLPNPLGPANPLIWDPEDPSRGVHYDELSHAFENAWRRAFHEPKPKGLQWHSFIRTTVTTIADAATIGAAAEYTGRSHGAAQRHYKRERSSRQEVIADLLDRERR